MSVDFHPSLKKHDCTAAVMCCMDFRFHKAICEYVRDTLRIPSFDLITEAGGSKYIAEEKKAILDNLRAELDISFHLHHIKVIVLVNHEDCGAYGGKQAFADSEAERRRHHADLRKAATLLKQEHPNAEIIPLYTFFKDGGIAFERLDA